MKIKLYWYVYWQVTVIRLSVIMITVNRSSLILITLIKFSPEVCYWTLNWSFVFVPLQVRLSRTSHITPWDFLEVFQVQQGHPHQPYPPHIILPLRAQTHLVPCHPFLIQTMKSVLPISHIFSGDMLRLKNPNPSQLVTSLQKKNRILFPLHH